MRSLIVASVVAATATVTLSSQRAVPRPSPQPGRTAIPRTESAVPFRVGEELSFDVSWSSFIVAGTAVARVEQKKASYDSTAYYVVVEGRPVPLVQRLYPLYYKMDTLIDAFGLLSQRGSLYAEEGADRRTSTTKFERAQRRAQFEEKSDQTLNANLNIPPETQDGLAALYSLRARALKRGDRLTIPIADSGALFTAEIAVGDVETVTVPYGRSNAWRLNVQVLDETREPVWNNVALWISSDARRLPVKMQAELPVGSFVLALRQAR
jgi:hypothetical protein